VVRSRKQEQALDIRGFSTVNRGLPIGLGLGTGNGGLLIGPGSHATALFFGAITVGVEKIVVVESAATVTVVVTVAVLRTE
jgi:hypothetical protein